MFVKYMRFNNKGQISNILNSYLHIHIISMLNLIYSICYISWPIVIHLQIYQDK